MRRMVIVLTTVMVVSGMILALANSAFAPAIASNRRRALQNSLSALFPAAKSPTFERAPIQGMNIYTAREAGGRLLGHAVGIETSGYGGTISLLVGLGPESTKIVGMEVVENVETPGLGARISGTWFRKQFVGLNPADAISFVKNTTPDPAKNQIEAISGATISTNAVVSGLNDSLSRATALIKQLGSR